MQKRVLPRKPVTLPSLDSLGAGLGPRMERASAGLGGLAFVAPQLVQRAPDALFAPLRHSLSDAYVALNGPSDPVVRSDSERDALDWLESRSSPLPSSDSASFFDALEDLNRRATDGRGGWRTGEIGTARDPRGNSIRFPPVSCVRPQLERLRHLLAQRGTGERPTLFTAAMALVLLTNCHPFRDGNGRVGRVLFNHVLRQGGMSRDVYIPVYELAARSRGGYLIAVRQGELRGEWDALMAFVVKLLDVCRGLVEWERGRSDD